MMSSGGADPVRASAVHKSADRPIARTSRRRTKILYLRRRCPEQRWIGGLGADSSRQLVANGGCHQRRLVRACGSFGPRATRPRPAGSSGVRDCLVRTPIRLRAFQASARKASSCSQESESPPLPHATFSARKRVGCCDCSPCATTRLMSRSIAPKPASCAVWTGQPWTRETPILVSIVVASAASVCGGTCLPVG